MAKKTTANPLLGLDDLFARADKILDKANAAIAKGKEEIREKKKLKKGCKNHPDRLIYRADLCVECDAEARNLRNKKNAEKEPWVSTDGLYRIYDDEGKIAYYHRWLVEQTLGIKLTRADQVKFKDGNKLNCTIENLVLLKETGLDLSTIVCQNCGSTLTGPEGHSHLFQDL